MHVELLISLVQERRAIYDPSDPMHHDRDVIAALWTDIATEMKCKESDCKEKWHQLRSNFMREKRKFTTHTSGSASIKAKKWVFYDAMEFLIPYVTPRATSCNVPTPPNEDINSEFDMDDASSTTNITDAPDSVRSVQTATNVDVCEGGSTSMSTPVIKQPSSRAKKHNANKRRRCELPSDVDGQIVGELQKLREQAVCKNENESDPDRQFLLSLLPLMKQLSPIDSIDIKIEIHQAFRRKLAKDQNSSYGYWTGQHQHPSNTTPSPYTSDNIIVPLSELWEELQKMIEDLNREWRNIGLKMNISKTKILFDENAEATNNGNGRTFRETSKTRSNVCPVEVVAQSTLFTN
ncbi:uncharacterized protein [Palaemon carinicauda]|uniref:uncharacterized protein n=1 Tax=Palaemon carinicauda TaxID=392227 RepID=UPI0035B5EA01